MIDKFCAKIKKAHNKIMKKALQIERDCKLMNTNDTTTSKENLQSMKMEIASELGVQLKNGYNGNLTSKEAGSIGGEMVKRMIQYASKNMK